MIKQMKVLTQMIFVLLKPIDKRPGAHNTKLGLFSFDFCRLQRMQSQGTSGASWDWDWGCFIGSVMYWLVLGKMREVRVNSKLAAVKVLGAF